MEEIKSNLIRNEQGWITGGSWVEFPSSNFKRVEWPKHGVIDVTFHKGNAKYRYHGIEPAFWEGIVAMAKRQDKSLGKVLRAKLVGMPDVFPFERLANDDS